MLTNNYFFINHRRTQTHTDVSYGQLSRKKSSRFANETL